ncbi:HD domain-containing protein [Arcanobacterium haemolyticum]|nr:HD domain-containing protein [Arcanobacterium haemolyticum]
MKIDSLIQARRGIKPRGAASRAEWSRLADEAVRDLWQRVHIRTAGNTSGKGRRIALAAVGSLGRLDCGPESDLDLVLMHEDEADLADELAAQLWYPIWDSHIDLDHAVRSLDECRHIANENLTAGLSMLDARFIAGDHALFSRARSAILADWRSAARRRFHTIVDEHDERIARNGELPYLIEGNLKEAGGGLRDALLIRALVASWLVERPEINYAEAESSLLDIRDALANVTRRYTPVLRIDYHDDVARILGYTETSRDPGDALLSRVAEASRIIRAAYQATERVARRNLQPVTTSIPRKVRGRYVPPHLDEVVPGVGRRGGELVLPAGVDPSSPDILLAFARESARTHTPIRPATLASMKKAGASDPLGEAFRGGKQWPPHARADLEVILASGAAQIPVWEALDVAGLLTRILPPWAHVRNLPQRSPIHHYTVDRHQIEATSLLPTCISARGTTFADLPDSTRTALLVATFFHDIGKRPAHPGHSERGADMIPDILGALGYGDDIIRTVTGLVAHHLLLGELATSADPNDESTYARISAACRGSADILDALHMLSQADARACKPKVWNEWRAGLVDALVRRAYPRLLTTAPAKD